MGYLKDCIADQGMEPLIVNTGYGKKPAVEGDISSGQVAKAGGSDIVWLRMYSDTGAASRIMVIGAIKILTGLTEKGLCHGVVSFGGVSNTTLATRIMKAIPFGIPKLMVSNAASMPAYAARFIETADITMMHSAVDISGINDLTKNVLERAAGGICGMAAVSSGAVIPAKGKALIAVTTFKFFEKCSQSVINLLEKKSYATIPFHAQGMSDQAMEQLIDQGLFHGVVDVVPAGVGEHLLKGNRDAGPNRLEAADRKGIPQVITSCGFDMLSCGPLSRKDNDDPLWISARLVERKIFIPDEYRVQARTRADELRMIAEAVADKLNIAKGPVRFIIPTKEWSSLSTKGADLYDPESDAVFTPALREHLRDYIEIQEEDMELNSTEFARILVGALEKMMEKII